MRFGFLAVLLLSPLLHAADAPASDAASASAQAPSALSSPSNAAPRLAGRVEGERYFSPTGTFSIPLPELDPDTGVVMDTPNIVVFRDRVATIITVSAIKMPPDEVWNFETSNPKDYTVHFLKEVVIPEFKAAFPDATPESAIFLPDLLGGTLLAYLIMPNGSAFEIDSIVRHHPDTKMPPAKRGILMFVHEGWVFVLTSELAERVTEVSSYILNTKDEDRILRERLIKVVNTITLLAPPGSSASATSKPSASAEPPAPASGAPVGATGQPAAPAGK